MEGGIGGCRGWSAESKRMRLSVNEKEHQLVKFSLLSLLVENSQRVSTAKGPDTRPMEQDDQENQIQTCAHMNTGAHKHSMGAIVAVPLSLVDSI